MTFRICKSAVLGAALIIPVVIAPNALRAEDQKTQTYRDKQRNEDHEWNAQEDKAYRMYEKQNNQKHVDFAKRKDNEQQGYWAWRHEHSDAALKIEVR